MLLLTACQSPGVVRPTVKIGLVAPFEGRYRYVGYDLIYAVRLALREANGASDELRTNNYGLAGSTSLLGGVKGYSVELVAYDDGADPPMAAEQARKLATDPGVVAAIGHFREETTSAASSAYAEAGIPLVAPAVLGGVGARSPHPYRLGSAASTLAHALLQYVGTEQVVALVSDSGPLGAALVEAAPLQRMKVLAVVSPTTTDWLAEVLSSGADAVICDADPVTAGEVLFSLRGAGWEGLFLGGPELAATDFVAVAGEAAEGAVFVTPYPFPADVPSTAGFVAAYQEVSGGVPPGPLALPAYEATWVLLEALERDIAAHGAPTREGVGAALSDTGRDGLLGHVTFDAGRDWSAAPLYWYHIGAGGIAQRIGGD
ncbi:MAG: branched-chain amino acid ABC transporter substrate-binding protein [Chloroflexota bacterium]|nr:branched-chain amino acid ABC transporter substrate-binding protein [Chloroflexota bacterium]